MELVVDSTTDFWTAFFESDAWLLIAVGFILGTFDRVMDWLENLVGYFQFLFVIDEYEAGVVLRFGKYSRTVNPGLHWIIPFGIEEVMKTTVVRRTSYLDVQSITSKDGKPVNSSPVVIYKIGNVKRWLLEVDDAEEALNDVTYGLNDALAAKHNWKDIHTPAYAEALTEAVRAEGVTWGARIEEVKFADRAQSKSLRLWTGGADVTDDE